jgi:hypothetical protein
MNNPDINGNWIFMAATNKNGDWGYWALTPIEGLEAGNGMLSEVKFRNDFFSFDDEDEHPHPKKSTNRPTGNLLLDAALTMNQASHFQGDLFGFGVGPSLSKGPFKFDASIGFVITGKGLRDNIDGSATLFGSGLNWKGRYNPDNGDFSSNTNLSLIGQNNDSWSFSLFFLKASPYENE